MKALYHTYKICQWLPVRSLFAGRYARGSGKRGPDGEINSPLHGWNAARLGRRPLRELGSAGELVAEIVGRGRRLKINSGRDKALRHALEKRRGPAAERNAKNADAEN